MWATIINAALGIWLMAAPAVLNYGKPAETNDRIIGPLIATFGIIAIWQITRGCRWMNLLLGMWLVIAPFYLGYKETVPTYNDVIVGLTVTLLALVRGKLTLRFGGGWTSLFCSTCEENVKKPPLP